MFPWLSLRSAIVSTCHESSSYRLSLSRHCQPPCNGEPAVFRLPLKYSSTTPSAPPTAHPPPPASRAQPLRSSAPPYQLCLSCYTRPGRRRPRRCSHGAPAGAFPRAGGSSQDAVVVFAIQTGFEDLFGFGETLEEGWGLSLIHISEPTRPY